jgi:predicted component of type VI protein secretion system
LSRFRLRYLHHDLEMSEGEFAVGRNASCQLSLDDPLVSRRHALLVVSGDTVTVRDLGSRNGVLVNGEKIDGTVTVGDGDRILIGAQEMTLVAMSGASPQPRRNRSLNRTMPKLPIAPESDAPPPMPPPMPSSAEARRMLTAPPQIHSTAPPTEGSGAHHLPEGDSEISMIRRQDAFTLLSGVADKALAMGRAVEAERILASPLADVIEASRAGKPLTPPLVDQAARFSAKLATATGKGTWADYVIELYAAQKRPVPAPVIDELYNALRRVASIDLPKLRDYIEALKLDVASYGPGERFLIQRLEGLERLAALK